MDAELKIDPKEYQELEEDARKALKTLNPEKIRTLKTTAISGLKRIISDLEKDVKSLSNKIKEYEDETKKKFPNPYRKYVLGFLAAAAFYFIASVGLKVPTELLWVSFPAGIAAIYMYIKVEIGIRKGDKEILDIFASGVNFCTAMHESLNTIKKNISADDVKLMIFCQSCKEFKLKPQMDIKHDFDQIAFLLYNNNIPFQPKIFTDITMNKFVSQISSLIETMRQRMA